MVLLDPLTSFDCEDCDEDEVLSVEWLDASNESFWSAYTAAGVRSKLTAATIPRYFLFLKFANDLCSVIPRGPPFKVLFVYSRPGCRL